MGLDVYLIKIEKYDTKILQEFLIETKDFWISTLDNPITEQQTELWNKQALIIAKRLNLPGNINDLFYSEIENIEIPSKKHPQSHFSIGYWRSSYSGGGINTVLRDILGQDLTSAFPEVLLDIDYISPNWQRAKDVMDDILNQFLEKAPNHPEIASITENINGEVVNFFHLINSKSKELQSDEYEQKILANLPNPFETFRKYVVEIEVIIETIEYVLSQPNPSNFMLMWSD